MATTQFVHIEGYARRSSTCAKHAKLSVQEVLAEAARAPGAAPHVEKPKAPALVFSRYGTDRAADAFMRLEQELTQVGDTAKDSKGKRLRADAPILLTGVASFPIPRAEVMATERARYGRYESLAVAWAQKRWGDRLRLVARHEDEEYLHIHFYAVPEVGISSRLDFDAMHPGRYAKKRAAQESPDNGKLQQVAYKTAMSDLQREFFEEVGLPCGLDLYGPRRARYTRRQNNEIKRRVVEKLATVSGAVARKEKILKGDADAAEVKLAIEKRKVFALSKAINSQVNEIASLKAELLQFQQGCGANARG